MATFSDVAQFAPATPAEGLAPQGQDIGDVGQFAPGAPPEGFAPGIEEFIPQKEIDGRNLADEFVTGFGGGIDSLQMSLFGVVGLAGRELGIKTLEDFGVRGAERNQAEASSVPSTAPSFSQIKDAGGFFKWAARTLGEGLPSIGLAIATGGVAGAIGKKVIENQIRSILQKRIAKNLLNKVGKKAAGQAASRIMHSAQGERWLEQAVLRGKSTQELTRAAFVSGARVGTATAGGIPITGQIDLELRAAGIDAGLTSILGGIAGGFMESLGATRLLTKMFPGVATQVSKNFVKDFAISAGIQASLEGATEAAQETIQLAALAYHDPSFDLFDPANAPRVIDAFAAGALIGLVTGGAADAFGSGTVEARKVRKRVAKATLPTFSLNEVLGDGLPEGFTPADNTAFQEVRGRVQAAVASVVEPIINSLSNGTQAVVDAIDKDMRGGMNEETTKFSNLVANAHNKFVAEHKADFEALKEFIAAKSIAITEKLKGIVNPETREEQMIREINTMKDEIEAFTARLQDDADSRDTQTQAEVDNMDFDNILTEPLITGNQPKSDLVDKFSSVSGTQLPTSFVFGKHQKEGVLQPGGKVQVTGYDNKKQARKGLKTLKKQFPSATDSTFEISQQEDGTYIISLVDVGGAEELQSDVIAFEGVKRARKSADRNPDKTRQFKPKGKVALDMTTLAFAGRDLTSDFAATSMQEGLRNIAGRMVESGDLTGAEAKSMIDKFDKKFPEAARDRGPEPKDPADFGPETAATQRPPGFGQTEASLRPLTEGEPSTIDDPRRVARQFETVDERQEREIKETQQKELLGRRKRPREPRSKEQLEQTRKAMAKMEKGNSRTAVLFGDLVDPDGAIANNVKKITAFVQRTLGLKNDIVVIDDVGLSNLIETGLVTDPIFQETLTDPTVNARNIRIEGTSYIYLSPKILADPVLTTLALGHEIGHQLYSTAWADLKPEGKKRLRDAFGEGTDAEFNEWMADQLATWIAQRKAPAGPVEAFFAAVGAKIRRLYQFIADNDRFQLDQTFNEFAEAVALKARLNESPAGNDPIAAIRVKAFFKHEGSLGYQWWGDLPSKNDMQIPIPRVTEQALTDMQDRFAKSFPLIASRAIATRNWVYNAYKLVLAPSTSVMRGLAKRIPAVNGVISLFGRENHGEAKLSSNYHQRIHLFKGQFMKGTVETPGLDRIMDGVPQLEQEQMAARLREGEGNPDFKYTEKEQQLRNLFDRMHEYAIASGLPVHKIVNYLPKQYSRKLLIDNKQKILDHMTIDMNLNDARSFYNSLLSIEAQDGRATGDAIETPGFRNMNSRRMQDKFFDQFLETNLEGIVANYVNALTKRAEFNRGLGGPAAARSDMTAAQQIKKGLWDPKAKLNELRTEMLGQNATDEEVALVEKYIDANLGQLGRDDISPGLRKAISVGIAYQNLRVLLWTVPASLGDMAGLAVRTGSMKDAYDSLKKNMWKIVKDDSDLADMARAYGIASGALDNHITTEFVDNHYMPSGVRKWNDAFFKWTGLNWYTDLTRKMALAVGIDYIQNMTERATTPHDGTAAGEKIQLKAKAALAELGLKPADVDAWVEMGKPIFGSISHDITNKTHLEVAEALVQFVDETIMRPNASQRPILASHPGAALIFHLKGYFYAMQDVVLTRILFNVKEADGAAQTLGAVLPVVAILGLTAVGLELREMLQYIGTDRTPPTDRMDGGEYLFELISRGGLTGISQLGFDFEDADTRGITGAAAIAGPTLGQIGDLLSKPATQNIPKAIPIVGQIPGLRDAVRSLL